MIIDGRQMATEVLARTKLRADKLYRRPNVLVYVAPDETPATRSYLKIKARSSGEAGCDFEETRSLTFSSKADAIIIQLPLSPEVDTREVLNTITLQQDADVLSDAAREKFERGDADAILPPVVAAIKEIFVQNKIEVRHKWAVVIGDGWLVGKPAAAWLTQQGASVAVVTSTTQNLATELHSADIIISGAGSPHLIKPEMLKNGVVLIDAGTSESGGTLVGDADPSCAAKCSIFTPVPGGVGPLSVACLFENVVALASTAK